MTKEQYVAEFAEALKISEEELLKGRHPEECSCGRPKCNGWRLAFDEDASDEDVQTFGASLFALAFEQSKSE